jgi:hypothetical protein
MRQLQWAYAQLTTPETMMTPLGTDGNGPLTFVTEVLPWRVPEGHTFGLEFVQFASKISPVSSYLVIPGICTVPSQAPQLVLPRPFWFPEGKLLQPYFINNSTELQWMTMIMQGVLISNVDPTPSSTV